MKSYSVIVAGATGMVGRKMLQVLEERNFPVGDLIPLASERSAGASVPFKGRQVAVRVLTDETLRSVKADVALFSAGAATSRRFSPVAAEAGTLVIDNSSAFRMEPAVPLVVPEVNREAIFRHAGIIANPNCSTIQMVVVLQPLHKRFRIERVVVSTYQSVTGAGKQGYDQLMAETAGGVPANPKFPHPIAFNCLPHIDEFLANGYTKEEVKMILETRKIMGDESIQVSPTCVRVPTVGGHSESVNVSFTHPFTLGEVRSLLASAPGVVLTDDPAARAYPMPIHAHDRDDVFVGRLRVDDSIPHGLNMWIVSDNLRKGAATNAVQIAEEWVKGPSTSPG